MGARDQHAFPGTPGAARLSDARACRGCQECAVPSFLC